MLSFKVIGCGAAGNKAAIDLVEYGNFNKENITLLNSTSRDIPEKYKNEAILFGNGLGGCGKERKLGKKMIITDMKENKIDFDSLISPHDQAVILVSSTEGGSGSASIPILAKYFKEVLGMNVICVLFFGFQEDTRGLQNSIELCQELSEEYTVVAISNSKFMDECSSNKFKAEKAANQQFIKLVRILAGTTIQSGSQVIDDTDLYKVVTTPGYLMADSMVFSNIPKNTNEFNEEIKNWMKHSKYIDPPKNAGMKREALIFTTPDEDDAIDYSCKVIDEIFGVPYEKFTNLSTGSQKLKFDYIISGMKLPVTEITALYNEYIERTKKVDKSSDTFVDVVSQMRGDSEDSMFDVFGGKKRGTISKNSFFDSFEDSGDKGSSDY